MSILDQHIRAQQLHEVLAGKSFTAMEVTRHFDTQLRIHFSDFGGHDPTGKTILRVVKDNEFLSVQMEGGYYLYWAGKETLYHHSPASLPKEYGIKLVVSDGSLLTIHIPGMGGCLTLANQQEYDAGKGQQTSRPRHRLSALDEERFTLDTFLQMAREKKDAMACSAMSALDDVGYMPDSLFVARINPRTKMKNLVDEDLRRWFEAIRQVNEEILRQHGEALGKDIFGCPGGYRRKMAGHLNHKACPSCGVLIEKQASITGEAFYYCPGCQPLIS